MGSPEVGDKLGFEFNGILAGWLHSGEGGHATSDVVTEKLGPDHAARIISIACGTGMRRGFYDWIAHFVEGGHERRDGTIVAAKTDNTAVARLAFSGALITELGMPALDAASKDAAKMTVKMTAQATHATPLPPAAAARALPAGPANPKPWLVSSYRLKIDGLNCAGVTRIESLTIKQKPVENPAGEVRTRLVITFPKEHGDDFSAWHEDFVVRGNNGDDNKRSGSLDYLSSDTNEVLFSLVFKLTPDKVEAGSENIRRVKAEMYCEEIHFKPGAGIWA